MNEDQKILLEEMSKAVGLSFEEMATVLGRDPQELRSALDNPETEEYKIQRRAYLLRKTKILNAIMDAAERDSPEAQKSALKIFESAETLWQRR